jgi:transposase
MAVAIAVTNPDYTAVDLRRLMSKERDGQVVRRLSALALILEGHSRTVAAEQSGMDRQTLRDWVHRYNAGGVEALVSGKSTGRLPKLDAAQMAQLYDLVVKGPDPEIDGVVRWRCVDLRAQIARRFSVDVPERTVAKWLRRLRLTRLQPRPFHPKQDLAAQETFKKTFAAWR